MTRSHPSLCVRLTLLWRRLIKPDLSIRAPEQSRELAQREAHFRLLIENALDVVMVLDPDGTVRFISSPVERVLGYTPDQVLGKLLFDYIHPDDLPDAIAALAHRVQHPGPSYSPIEARVRHQDGSWRVIQAVGANALDNPAVAGIVLNCRDITDQKRAEEEIRKLNAELEQRVVERTARLEAADHALLESQTFLNQLIAASPGLIFQGGAHDFALTFISPSVQQILGYAPAEILGVPYWWPQHIHPDDRAAMITRGEQAVRARAAQTEFEHRLLCKDGNYRWFYSIVRYEYTEAGNLATTLGVVLDITGRKRAEEALRKVKDELESRVAEQTAELSAAVTQLESELAERKRAEEQVQSSQTQLRALAAHLQTVREEEASRIARQVHDELGQALTALKLDLAWLSKNLARGQKALRDKTRSMSALVNSTVKLVRKVSQELRPVVLDDLGLTAALEWQTREIESRSKIRCKFVSTLDKDGVHREIDTALFRIFQEVLTNVVRHANATEINILLKVDAGKVMLQVEDNGRGITESEMSDPKSLGLLSMRERALSLGGWVSIRGVARKGTTVTVEIPLRASQRGEDGHG